MDFLKRIYCKLSSSGKPTHISRIKIITQSTLISIIVFIGLIILYNLIPFIIYLFSEYVLKRSQRKRAKQLDPKSPLSPWVKTKSINTNPNLKRDLIEECLTVSQLFSRVTERFKDKHCFGCRRVVSEDISEQSDGKTFKKVSLTDFQWFNGFNVNEMVENISKGFLFVGIKPKDIVMIFAETSIEWMISCQSILRIGSTVATLYATLGEEGITHAINESEVTYLITSFDLLPKLSEIIDKLSKLKSIIYTDGHKDPDLIKLFSEKKRKKIEFYSLKDITDFGKKHKDLKGIDPKPDDTAVLMYTSGSTGTPKAVMISHTNLLTAVKCFYSFADALVKDDVYIAYLPLAHILEMSAELFFITNGLSVGYATIQTLTDKSNGLMKGIKGDITLLRPTIMAAVPLILDRIKKAVNEEIERKNIFLKFFIKTSLKYKCYWTEKGWTTPLINIIVCRKFRKVLGGKLKLIATGGAPLTPDTHRFIRSAFDIILLQGYGLTETSASATLTDIDDTNVGFVGPPLEGIQIRLIDWTEGNCNVSDKPNPRGEIVIGGDSVSKGYFKNDSVTREYYKVEDGIKWFYTGDIGEIYPNGSLKIIDRKKDIIKLSTGEYISLAKIEGVLKQNTFVDNVCVFGDSHKDFVIALIVPNNKFLEDLAKSLSKPKMDLKQMCNDSDITAKVQQLIEEKAKESKLLKVEIPKKIKLCSEEWVPDNGLVTAALKLKRKNIQEFYQKSITGMYSQ